MRRFSMEIFRRIINKLKNKIFAYGITMGVLMSAGKAARCQTSICNRTNTCGSMKKAGLAPRVGWYVSSNTMLVGAPQSVPRFCIPNTTIQTQKYGYRATIRGSMG